MHPLQLTGALSMRRHLAQQHPPRPPCPVSCLPHCTHHSPHPHLPSLPQVHCDEGPGDILVFLTGQEEIEACERLISERGAALPPDPDRPALLVLPIYAALPPEQQLRVFAPAPPNTRKVRRCAIAWLSSSRALLLFTGMQHGIQLTNIAGRPVLAHAVLPYR